MNTLMKNYYYFFEQLYSNNTFAEDPINKIKRSLKNVHRSSKVVAEKFKASQPNGILQSIASQVIPPKSKRCTTIKIRFFRGQQKLQTPLNP